MPSTLIVYSTVDGHTLKICQRMRDLLEGRSHEVNLLAVDEAWRSAGDHGDQGVLGARLREGRIRLGALLLLISLAPLGRPNPPSESI